MFSHDQKTTSCEAREGTCYEKGIDLTEVHVNDELYVAEIPAPRLPIYPPIPSINNVTLIYKGHNSSFSVVYFVKMLSKKEHNI